MGQVPPVCSFNGVCVPERTADLPIVMNYHDRWTQTILELFPPVLLSV